MIPYHFSDSKLFIKIYNGGIGPLYKFPSDRTDQSISTLLIIPLKSTFTALVKHTHGLISTSDLHLHEVGLVVRALGAVSHGLINILPSRRSAQNIVHLFSFRSDCIHKGLLQLVSVGTRRTNEDGGRVIAVAVPRPSYL